MATNNNSNRQNTRNRKNRPQRKRKIVKAPEGYTNAGQPVPYAGVSIQADEVETTTTLTGTELQIGMQSEIVDLGFSEPIDLGNRIVDIAEAEFIRSREITFTGQAFKPKTRLYPFFDGVDVSAECKPDGGSYGDPLICSSSGQISGTFLIPNREGKRFRTGDRKFRLSASPTNDRDPSYSFGEANYTARGWVDVKQQTTFSTRLSRVDNRVVSKEGSPISISDSVVDYDSPCPRDPIAQTFFVYEDGGCFLTAIDVFFYSKDPNLPVILQVREMDESGNPSINILPFGEVIKETDEVVINKVDLTTGTLTVTGDGSTPGVDAGPWSASTSVRNDSGTTIVSDEPITLSGNPALDMIPTRFVFESPIYLAPNQGYAFVLLSDSVAPGAMGGSTAVPTGTDGETSEETYADVEQSYQVWVAQSGPDINHTELSTRFREQGIVNQNIGTSDPILRDPYFQGIVFKSQNGISWTPDQTVDMKFALHKAVFDIDDNGEIDYVNVELPLRLLGLDPFQTKDGSSKVRVMHPDHGLTVDGTSPARVIFTGLVGGLNGIPSGVIDQAEGHLIEFAETDFYIIDLGAGNEANADGRIGGNAVYATENIRYEELTLITTPLEVPGTELTWTVTPTGSAGVNENISQTKNIPYEVSASRNVDPNTPIVFSRAMQVSSAPNELHSGNTPSGPSQILSEDPKEKKSLHIKAVLSSSNINLSPVVDTSRLSVALKAHRIDDPSGYVPVGSTITPATIINHDTFDVVDIVPTTEQPAVADVSGLIHFSTTDEFITATSVTSAADKVTGVGTIFTVELEVGDIIKDPNTGNEAEVVEIISDTELLTNIEFDPPVSATTLEIEPAPLTIKTADPTVALHLSKLDVGKLVSISGTTTNARDFSDAYVLSVIYEKDSTYPDPQLSNQPALCEVVIDYRYSSTVSAGFEAANFTLTQKDRYVDEIAPSGGSCASKYVSKKLSLARASNTLKIMFDAYRHESNQIDLYYRLDLVDDTTPSNFINWTLAEYNLDVDGNLIPMTPEADDEIDSLSSYEANLIDLPDFTSAQVKIVMRGGNPAKSPIIKNLRLIALEE